ADVLPDRPPAYVQSTCAMDGRTVWFGASVDMPSKTPRSAENTWSRPESRSRIENPPCLGEAVPGWRTLTRSHLAQHALVRSLIRTTRNGSVSRTAIHLRRFFR